MMTNEALERIVRDQVDGFQYIINHVSVHRSGSLWQGLCPFHNERTGSFTVYPKDSPNSRGYASWYCFGCHQGGDVIRFKQLLDDLPSRDAAMRALAAEEGIVVDEDTELMALRMALAEADDETGEELITPAEVNLQCSVMIRRLLEDVAGRRPDAFDDVLARVDAYMTTVDAELLRRTAGDLSALVDETATFIRDLTVEMVVRR